MPDKILLKGFFDSVMRDVGDDIKDLMNSFNLEIAKPTNWTKKQALDIMRILQVLDEMSRCLSTFAASARDD